MSSGLTQTQAAELLGVKQPYVSRLLKEGRLRRVEGSKKIDPASVDEIKATVGSRRNDSGSGGRAEPATIGDPRVEHRVDTPPHPSATASQPAPEEVDAVPGVQPGDWDAMTYGEARRRKEANTAWLKYLEAQQKAGELVDRGAVMAQWEEIALQVRERMLGLSTRAATRLGLTPEQKDDLDGLVREVLGEFLDDDTRH